MFVNKYPGKHNFTNMFSKTIKKVLFFEHFFCDSDISKLHTEISVSSIKKNTVQMVFIYYKVVKKL